MSSLKPYLIRGVYDWIVDNGLTPYLLVNAEIEGARVPKAFVEEGRIVLNLRPEAVSALELGNEFICFSARFGGKPMQVDVPTTAVMALYAKENGRGMIFDEEDEGDVPPPPPPPPPEPKPKAHPPETRGRPTLRVVK